MAVDKDRAARLTSAETTNEVPAVLKSKAKSKPGPDTLRPGEPTERVTTNLPETVFVAMQRKVARLGKGLSLAGYLRELVERDLKAS